MQGKTTVVTGAARGIGRAVAERFAAEGARVVIGDIRDEDGKAVAEAIRATGGEAVFQHCDVGDGDEVAALCQRAVETFGRLDCAVANAGIAVACDFLAFEEAEFDRVLRTNLRGSFLTVQAAARRMRDGGSIVLMSSINGILAMPHVAANCVSKGGMNQLAKAAGLALADRGIRVNALAPGSVDAGMVYDVSGQPDNWGEMLSRTPLRRVGTPAEIAAATLFLASDDSSYMTGQCVTIDGGRMALNYTVPPLDG
ncbi:SDR family NAD(P)-dependent oxidoreductase [Ferruginivarius sediminum]|uniref:SDR family NAD(P)-dependent oxidoreductase n=2 Tax=Ferruginivarius sediminum TaxID=2661937 RepID=A0A369T8X6_9PROT|nr:SDR family NAD(P)-dependent oxidoreductase [Ferruginivarius sediminum]